MTGGGKWDYININDHILLGGDFIYRMGQVAKISANMSHESVKHLHFPRIEKN